MPTSIEIKNNVDEQIIEQTAAQSITRENVGNILKSMVDYTDQETDAILQNSMAPTIFKAPTVTAVNTAIAAALVGVYQQAGSWDASGGTFPTVGTGGGGSVQSGDVYRVSVAGTLGGVAYSVDNTFYAIVDNPGQTAGNWDRWQYDPSQATETTAGTARIATSEEAIEADSDELMMTPVKTKLLVNDLIDELPTVGEVQDLIEQDGYSPPYTSFVFRATQSGTSAPTVTTIYNNTGITPNIGYAAVGAIGIILTGYAGVVDEKVQVTVSPKTSTSKRLIPFVSVNGSGVITIRTYNLANAAYENDMLLNTQIELKIYN